MVLLYGISALTGKLVNRSETPALNLLGSVSENQRTAMA